MPVDDKILWYLFIQYMPRVKCILLLNNSISFRDWGCLQTVINPLGTFFFSGEIHITPEQVRLHDKAPIVRCATFGNDIRRVLTEIHVHGLDNALSLGLPSVVIVKDIETPLELSGRHDSKNDNR